jgi:hypothetical protein
MFTVYGGFFWKLGQGEMHFGAHLDLRSGRVRLWRAEGGQGKGPWLHGKARWDPWRERIVGGPRLMEEESHNARVYDALEAELRLAIERAWCAASCMGRAEARQWERRIYSFRPDREREARRPKKIALVK